MITENDRNTGIQSFQIQFLCQIAKMNETIMYLIVIMSANSREDSYLGALTLEIRRDVWVILQMSWGRPKQNSSSFLIDNWLNSFLADDQNRKGTLVEDCKIATLIWVHTYLLASKKCGFSEAIWYLKFCRNK